ncbi:MAG: type VI secretion system tip protein VgrG [Chitinivibrionales bacterium]|nr:type VI secretion system tip protein VgrG [Chitinivibrionales bacterium]
MRVPGPFCHSLSADRGPHTLTDFSGASPVAKANQSQFIVAVAGVDAATFGVADFSGTDQISSPYRFDVTLTSARHDIDPKEIVGCRVSLFMERGGEFYPYSGVVTEFQFIDRSTDYATYTLRFAPALWLLSLNHRSRVFQKMSVPSIVERVLDECGLGDTYEVDLEQTYPECEYVVQYQESDLNFVSRLLESQGIHYLFRETPLLGEELDGEPVTEQLIISDRAATFEDIAGNTEILFRSRSGMHDPVGNDLRESIERVGAMRRIVPREILLRNYNYRTPEVDLNGKSEIRDAACGTVYEFGGDGKDTQAVQAAADIARKRVAVEQAAIDGVGSCRGFRAGGRFTLSGHGRSEINDAYVITRVIHTGSQHHRHGDTPGSTYTNRFSAIPGDCAADYAPPKRAVAPRIPGIITAAVEADGSNYAALDDMGRYKVRLPFDTSDSDNYDGSKYVRMAQPYSGANYGIHFPSHEGAEMVLACVDGDPNKPLGLGTIPNANTLSPVVSTNKEQNVIRTAGNNELLMDDTEGKQRVRLLSAGGNLLMLDDGERLAALQTTDDNMVLLDDHNGKCTIKGGKHTITLSFGWFKQSIVIKTKGGHIIRMDDMKDRVTIQSAGGHVIDMNDKKKTITLRDRGKKNTVTLDGAKGLTLDSSGDIKINSKKDVSISAQNIEMNASSGNLQGKAARKLDLKGSTVDIEASTGNVKIEGLKTEVRGTMSAALIGGTEVDISAKARASIAAATVDVKARALTTIKGGMVMIN